MFDWCEKCRLQLTADTERLIGFCRFCIPPATRPKDPKYQKQKRIVEKLKRIAELRDIKEESGLH